MNTLDIEATFKEICGIQVSEGSISNITNTVMENIKQWQCKLPDSSAW
jgi:transposase-like protein